MVNKHFSSLLKWLLAFVPIICLAQRQVKQTPKYNFSYLESKISSWVDSGYYNGASVIVVKDNKTIYKHYFGDYAPETVVYIASAGKWLAAATIAAVVDEGKLHWTDKANRWIPECTGAKGEATLLQLLSHTAGYPDYHPKGEHPDNYQTLQEAVTHIINLPADTLPGTVFKYGGLAMQVAGRMAELATGKDWETIFQEKLAKPLNMRLTHFTPVDETPGHNPMLGGGARTCLNDYANFLNMISHDGNYQGKRILSIAAVQQLQANQVGVAYVNRGEFVENVRASSRKDIYGLSEWREEVNANGKAALISSPSWAGAYPWIDKVHNVYGFFLARVAKVKNGFSSFYASPVLPLLVRDIIKDASLPDVKRGFILTNDSAHLFYEELGKGQPLIFIHGHAFDHYEWEPQFYEFAKHYRVIRYDVRGYGRSSMPTEFSNSSHANDLLQLMNQLHISKAHLIGLSMGGFIATDFLALYQDRLLSVTLASGDVWGGSPGPAKPWTISGIAQRRTEISNLYKKGIDVFKREWFNALTMRNGQPIQHIRKPIWEMIYKWDAWQPTHVEPRFLLGTSVVDILKQKHITVPVLVLTGEVDRGRENQLLQLLPMAQQAIVPNAGHVSNLENVEGFNRAVMDFIRAKPTQKLLSY